MAKCMWLKPYTIQLQDVLNWAIVASCGNLLDQNVDEFDGSRQAI